MKVKIIATNAIYHKVQIYSTCADLLHIGFGCIQVLKLSYSTIGQLSIGHVVNLASNDVHRFDGVSTKAIGYKSCNISRICT